MAEMAGNSKRFALFTMITGAWTATGTNDEYSIDVTGLGMTTSSDFYVYGAKYTGGGTVGLLNAGNFNLTGTTLTIKVTANSFYKCEDGDSPNDLLFHPKIFNSGVMHDLLGPVPENMEWVIQQVQPVNIDALSDGTMVLATVDSEGIKEATSIIDVLANDMSYIGVDVLKTGQYLKVYCDKPMTLQVTVYERSTADA